MDCRSRQSGYRARRPHGRVPRWRVSLVKGTPAKFIDFTLAPDASIEGAIAKALQQGKHGIHKIAATHSVGVGVVQRIKAAL